MKYCVPTGDETFYFNAENAEIYLLEEAIKFNDSFEEVYEHKILDNIEDIKKTLEHLRKE